MYKKLKSYIEYVFIILVNKEKFSVNVFKFIIYKKILIINWIDIYEINFQFQILIIIVNCNKKNVNVFII